MATTVPRTAEEIRAQILEHGPWWLREPEEVTDAFLWAIAAIFAEAERVADQLFDMTLIGEAVGDWLLEHGREHDDVRLVGESDEDYRARIIGIQDQVTRPAILAAVQALLKSGTVAMEEATLDGGFLIPEGAEVEHATWLNLAAMITSAKAFRLLIPAQDAPSSYPGFLGVAADGWEDSREFLVPEDGGGPYPHPGLFMGLEGVVASATYAEIARVVEQMRAAGVVARIELAS